MMRWWRRIREALEVWRLRRIMDETKDCAVMLLIVARADPWKQRAQLLEMHRPTCATCRAYDAAAKRMEAIRIRRLLDQEQS